MALDLGAAKESTAIPNGDEQIVVRTERRANAASNGIARPGVSDSVPRARPVQPESGAVVTIVLA